MKFSVLHVKNSRGLIEPSADHSGSHVRWNVSSLSPVGPIVQTSKSAEHHGVVQVFKEVGHENSFSFRVYLAGNNCSDIKVRKHVKRFISNKKPTAFTEMTQCLHRVLFSVAPRL